MKIKQIELFNFGSYEGKNVFNFNVDNKEKKIILIGGKNGAGKTTLFTAIKLCLYGHNSFGYRSVNSYYNKKISKLINNNAKRNEETEAYIKITFLMNGGQGVNCYEITRGWKYSNNTVYEFKRITKDNHELTDDEIVDFETYLTHIIPPEMFDLYFFDGENIADFFLSDDGNKRIKNAFLMLCGYDTFSIMENNFKRVYSKQKPNDSVSEQYFAMMELLEKSKRDFDLICKKTEHKKEQLNQIESEIEAINYNYQKNGGATKEEYDKLNNELRILENRRENKNTLIKKIALEILPMWIIKDKLFELREQLFKENENIKSEAIADILNSADFVLELSNELKKVGYSVANRDLKKVVTAILEPFQDKTSDKNILKLSPEEQAKVLTIISRITDFDIKELTNCKKSIKSDITKGKNIREKMSMMSTDSSDEYIKRISSLLNEKNDVLAQLAELESKKIEHLEIINQIKSDFDKSEESFKQELKSGSINNISVKAIKMLSELQEMLYKEKIAVIEKRFVEFLSVMMRKNNFIDSVVINNDFNIKVYKNEIFDTEQILNLLKGKKETEIATIIGEKALEKLLSISGSLSVSSIIRSLKRKSLSSITLPIEIDKNSLSKGEKQMFVMALYSALMVTNKKEIPFVIDTPFARIDSEHRMNISKYFFKGLESQVFILSTNEEIDENHVKVLQDNISNMYMLENTDNSRTTIIQDRYF